jgi:hypothetical protein
MDMTESSIFPWSTRRLASATLACLVALVPALPAAAALPPEYQRLAELEAILQSPDVSSRLMEAPIDAIERVGEDVYSVRAAECTLEVRIVDDPSAEPMPGPREFLLEVGDAVCE